MSSFSTEVKNELARFGEINPCCQLAELAALIRMGGNLTFGRGRVLGINFTTENAAVARKTLTLLKERFALQTEVTVSRGRRLKKSNHYLLRVVPAANVSDMLTELGIIQGDSLNVKTDVKLLRKSCCRNAYLRGAFLGGGSVSRPEGGNHLELVALNYQFAAKLAELCKRLYLPAGMTERKSGYVVYLKDGDAIMELLSHMGARETITELEIVRNVKDVRNQVNRLVNCETANLQKTVDASYRQVAKIKLLQERGGLSSLPEGLQEMARLRLEHPQATLQELVNIMGNAIGKSGVNHRLRKIEQLADQIIERKPDGD